MEVVSKVPGVPQVEWQMQQVEIVVDRKHDVNLEFGVRQSHKWSSVSLFTWGVDKANPVHQHNHPIQHDHNIVGHLIFKVRGIKPISQRETWLQVFVPSDQAHTVRLISCLKNQISWLNMCSLGCCPWLKQKPAATWPFVELV